MPVVSRVTKLYAITEGRWPARERGELGGVFNSPRDLGLFRRLCSVACCKVRALSS